MNLARPFEAAEARPLLGVGRVRHRRLRPVEHAFEYPTWFLLLPMRHLRRTPCATLNRNRAGWVSFHDRDHGDGREDCLAWLEDMLASRGLSAPGEVWLHTSPRLGGYAFKPVSFWYCHGQDGKLAAIVAEVNNTFGERHCYVLDEGSGHLAWGQELQANKGMQVSPFCRIEGRYRFRFMHAGPTLAAGRSSPADQATATPRTVVRIDYDDTSGPLLATSVSGELAELTPARLRQVLWRMPLLSLGVIARIHWQALKLWLRRVPFHGKSGLVTEKTSTPLAHPH